MKLFRTTAIAILLLATMAGLASACPTCKESVAENGGNLVQGYFWSIIFMMSMPFLIFSGLSTMFYLDVRRARNRQALASANQKPWLADEAEALPVGSA